MEIGKSRPVIFCKACVPHNDKIIHNRMDINFANHSIDSGNDI